MNTKWTWTASARVGTMFTHYILCISWHKESIGYQKKKWRKSFTKATTEENSIQVSKKVSIVTLIGKDKEKIYVCK